MGGKSLCFSLFKKRAIFRLFFRIFEGREADLLGGGQKIKLIVFCLSLTPSFFLRNLPRRRTNDRFQIEWQIRIKALLPRMLLLPSEIRERVRFFTPHHIGLLPIFERERGREINKIISFVSFSLCLLLSAPPPQPLSSISRRRRAIIAKEQI